MLRASAATTLLALTLIACADDTAPAASRGKACRSVTDCGELVCVADSNAHSEDLAALPLVCDSSYANGLAPGKACEHGSECASGICLLSGACASPCADESDCAERERCQSVYARTSDTSLEALHACVAMVDLPSDATVDVRVDKHALSVGTSEVPLASARAEGSTLYVLEHLSPMWPGTLCRPPLCIEKLRTADASHRLLFDSNADYAQTSAPLSPVASGDHFDPAVIMLPIGSSDVASEAGYVASVNSEHAGDLRVTRLSRSKFGKRLDLNVFYVGALDWKPEGTRGPPLLAQALDIVDEIFAQAGLTIGEVRQIAVRGKLPERGVTFAEQDPSQGFSVLKVRYGVYMELPSLFRLSAGAGNSAVNLFFLSDLEPRSDDGEPEAEAGGIPGPLGMQGTAASGIAIATDMMAGDAPGLGRTLAHELAHYLGLFHTSESNGVVLDALTDTPECRLNRDQGGDGLSAADCEGFGADNLMFWAKGTGTVLTPQQRAVLQRALILH